VFTTRPELTGDFGMVASTHWLASAAGMSVLERGGNAFDAAVTAGFVLQVVEPHLNGPGGEVPILLWSEADERVSVICGQGTAPAAATIDHFTGLGLDLVPGTGLLAATVPAGTTSALDGVGEPTVRADGRVRGDTCHVGRLSAVAREDAEPGFLRAAANPRGAQGYAVGR
jgi:gamma-glutamyltranspeptidase